MEASACGTAEVMWEPMVAFRLSALLYLVPLIFLLAKPHRFPMGFRLGKSPVSSNVSVIISEILQMCFIWKLKIQLHWIQWKFLTILGSMSSVGVGPGPLCFLKSRVNNTYHKSINIYQKSFGHLMFSSKHKVYGDADVIYLAELSAFPHYQKYQYLVSRVFTVNLPALSSHSICNI